MNNIKNVIGDLTKRIEQIEKWVNHKRESDSKTENEIKALQLSNVRHEGELLQHAKLIEKMIFPHISPGPLVPESFSPNGLS
ncbi:unnamed protein product [Rotaria sp. Silwood1]|nr:unnamed protein product [Rotaria sp. Silwood1]CAF5127201.1 unnamed protein product [Rotaria sp. Silwood1]